MTQKRPDPIGGSFSYHPNVRSSFISESEEENRKVEMSERV